MPTRECSVLQEEKCRTVWETVTEEQCVTDAVEKCGEEMTIVCHTLHESICNTKYEPIQVILNSCRYSIFTSQN